MDNAGRAAISGIFQELVDSIERYVGHVECSVEVSDNEIQLSSSLKENLRQYNYNLGVLKKSVKEKKCP